MADISALSMISERMQIHERLVNSTDFSTTDLLAFSKEVSDVSNKTTNCAKDVAKYATRINEDLTKLRQLIKDFTVENGDKLKWKPSQKLDCLKVQKHKKKLENYVWLLPGFELTQFSSLLMVSHFVGFRCSRSPF